jgi:(p)ppGpp synthase/HD superfamily hydrolase
MGFGEDVVIAALLHDVVEDAGVSIEAIGRAFGANVASWVDECTERKVDAAGNPRSWIDRKRDHLEVYARASRESRVIALADKCHNLSSILNDLRAGKDVWAMFHAGREQVIWYFREAVACLRNDEPANIALALEAEGFLEAIERMGG